MNPPLEIRTATPSDIPGMSALLEALFALEKDFTFDEGKQRRGLELLLSDVGRSSAFVACDENGMVAGMVTIQLVASTAEGAYSGWVEDLVVGVPWRGQGVARSLLSAAMAWGASKGATRFQLLADRNNENALEFYRHIGWSGTSMICLRRNV